MDAGGSPPGGGNRSKGGDDRSETNRRAVLAAAGSLALGGLAGCRGSGYEIVDSTDTFGHAFPYPPDSVNLNPWPTASYPYQFYTMLFEPMSVTVPGEGYRLTDVVEDLTLDGSAATVRLADGFTWWNGEDVTAGDRLVYERIQSVVSDEDRPPVEQLDRRTLRYEFDGTLAEPLVRSHVVGEAVHTARWLFDRWVEEFESASTEAALDDAVERLQEWHVPLERAVEDGFGNGPYRLVEASLNRLMMEPYEDHPRADEIDIPELWFPSLQSVSWDEFVAKGRVDGGRGLLSTVNGTPAPHVEQLDEYPTTNGVKLALDWREPHVGRPEVRRAILAVIPIEELLDVGDFGDPVTVQTGLSAPARRRWLDGTDGFRDHPIEGDRERAAEHMRAAGYERGGDGDWRDPDGEKVQFRLRSPIWDEWKFAAQVAAETFDEFGFDVDFSQIANTRLIADVREHNFDAILWWSDARPYRTYDVSSTLSATLGYGVADPDATESEQGKPIEVSVPERGTVNLVEEWERLRTARDDATTRAAIETFARWWNEALPDIQLATRVTGVWGNTRDFSWPPAEGATYRAGGPGDRPEYTLLNRGRVRRGSGSASQ